MMDVHDGQVRLPIGKYRLNHWEIQRKDQAGATWDLVAEAPASMAAFEVAADKPVVLDLGEPIAVSLGPAQSENGIYTFVDPKLSGRLGEHITVTCGKQMPPPPRLAVRNADGTYDRHFSFEYG